MMISTLTIAVACGISSAYAKAPAPGVSPARAAQLWRETIEDSQFKRKHAVSSATALAKAQYFQQRQDNYDATNTDTWQQAYYVNDTFWTPGSDAPVFVCVGACVRACVRACVCVCVRACVMPGRSP